MFCFASGKTYDNAQSNAIRAFAVGRATVASWCQFCRELVTERYIGFQTTRGHVGGPGRIVQIDEAKFGRRKYHRGRLVDGHWLLDIIEDGSQDFRLEVTQDNRRNAATLTPLIRRHVARGSTIRTDEWLAYRTLPEHGYSHQTVCHRREFVTPQGVHTQRVEAFWRPLRQFLSRRRISDEHYANTTVEYQWRRYSRSRSIDMFEDLLCALRHEYPLDQK